MIRCTYQSGYAEVEWLFCSATVRRRSSSAIMRCCLKVFDDQDSGNICFGTEKDGQRYFIKFAGTVLLLCLWTRLFVICIEQKKYRFPLSAPMMRKELTLSYRNIRSFSRERLEKFLYRLYQITNFNPLIPFLLSLFMVYCM